MKTFKQKLLTLVITMAFAIPVFCAGQASSELNKPENGFAADTSLNDTITVYTCPMHPEIISDKPGKCPKCGMDLIQKNSSSEPKMNMMMCPMHGMVDMNHKHDEENKDNKKMMKGMGIAMGAMMVVMMTVMIIIIGSH